jgi:hypothetical protein
VTTNGRTVQIPATAVDAAVPFTAGDLGDATLSYQDDQWFMTAARFRTARSADDRVVRLR